MRVTRVVVALAFGIIPAVWFFKLISGTLPYEHSSWGFGLFFGVWLSLAIAFGRGGSRGDKEPQFPGGGQPTPDVIANTSPESKPSAQPGFWERRALRKAALAEEARQRREERAAKLERASSGPLATLEPRAALLRRNEVAHAAVAASLRELKTVGYRGRSSGLSVRVAKGVTYRTGGHGGGAVRKVVETARGELVVTNQRVLFAGDLKSLAIRLEDLVSVTFHHRTVLLGTSRRTYELLVVWNEDLEVFRIILERLARQPAL